METGGEDMSQTKQTFVQIFFESENITKDLAPDLLSFSYSDSESMEADTISLTLKDEKAQWAGCLRSESGEVVKATITPGDVEGLTGKKLPNLFCGSFYVDSYRFSGSPRTCEITAVSVPLNTPIRRKTKTRAWEKKDLNGIAQQIAQEAGMVLAWDCQDNPFYDREDQKRESDLSFLMRLCEDAGLSLKVIDKKLVIFDQQSYEKKAPVKTLTLGESNILSYDFTAAVSETYKSVTVKYRDPTKHLNIDKELRAEALVEYTHEDPTVDSSGQEFEMKTRAKNQADAERLAKAKLRSLNRRSVTGNMSLVGDIELVAGQVVAIAGVGKFSGNFIISSATHDVSSSGYTTSIEVRRVNKNY